jgi:hypothetical protein
MALVLWRWRGRGREGLGGDFDQKNSTKEKTGEKEMFFFEKKNQKTFAHLGTRCDDCVV